MAEHKDLTGTALHEPKGVSGASVGQVYVADGAGSGAWDDPLGPLNNANTITLNTYFPDISAASSAWAVSPLAGSISAVYVVLRGAITVTNSIVTGKIAGVLIGGLSITVTQAASAAGSTFSDTSITSANTVTAGQAIEIVSDGGSSTTVGADVTIVLNVA